MVLCAVGIIAIDGGAPLVYDSAFLKQFNSSIEISNTEEVKETAESAKTTGIVLIVVGILLFLGSFMACICMRYRHTAARCFFTIYMIFSYVMFAIFITAFILILNDKHVSCLFQFCLNFVQISKIQQQKSIQINSMIYQGSQTAMLKYRGLNASNEESVYWNTIQYQLQCCGLDHPDDWLYYDVPNGKYPLTCCRNASEEFEKYENTKEIPSCVTSERAYKLRWTDGCYGVISSELASTKWYILGPLLFAAIVMVSLICNPLFVF